MDENDFKLIKGYKGYVSKPEITDLSPAFLVRGSKNVLVDYAQRVVSRLGYSLYGAAGAANSVGSKGSYEWETSTGKEFPFRSGGSILEFYWNSTWNTLKTGLTSPYLEFAKIWDNTEKIDVLLWVLGETNTYKWSGGVAKIRSSTATTLTKQGVIAAQYTTSSLGNPTVTIANPAVVTLAAHGLVYGDQVQFTTTGNLPTGILPSTTYYVYLVVDPNTFQISTTPPTTPGTTAIVTTGSQSGTHTLIKQHIAVAGTIAFVAGTAGTVAATITDSANNFLNAGFAAGDTLNVSGSASNTRNFTIASVTAGIITLIMSDVLVSEAAGPSVTIHNGEPTWASSRFLTTGTRSIHYNGTDYTYTGGENTETLTGLTAFPAVTLADPTWQTPITLLNPVAIPSTFKQDLIGVQLNQLVLSSTKSQDVYVSSSSDYTNFTLTSPRAPGDPAHVTMDNYCTCIVPIDNAEQTTSSLMFGGGKNEFFQFSYQLAQDNSSELVRMVKFKTATGSGLISKGAIGPIKNSTIYISNEPALDSLSNLQSSDRSAVPFSDSVKDDFDSYDFTYAHVKYWKRAVYVALPAEGLLLIYDLMRNLWQPPQTIPVSRLAIIDGWLYGHSALRNESYRLFDGTNDNGNFIPQVARFAYNNSGRRDRLKNMSQYWSDGYISPNGTLMANFGLGFDGIDADKTVTISGSDTSITTQKQGSPLGNDPIGSNPLGGGKSGPILGAAGFNTNLLRFWQLDDVSLTDYTEQFTEYSMNTKDGQFAIVAHGNNACDAGTSPVTHRK